MLRLVERMEKREWKGGGIGEVSLRKGRVFPPFVWLNKKDTGGVENMVCFTIISNVEKVSYFLFAKRGGKLLLFPIRVLFTDLNLWAWNEEASFLSLRLLPSPFPSCYTY